MLKVKKSACCIVLQLTLDLLPHLALAHALASSPSTPTLSICYQRFPFLNVGSSAPVVLCRCHAS